MKYYLSNLAQFLFQKQLLLIGLLATLISVSASTYFFQHNQILLYNDARSHLDISRRVTDSLTPGIMQIGSVWLPLYQILMLPLIQINFLWHTGLAGTIISSLAFIIAAIFLYKLLKLLTNSAFISSVGTLLFCLNPNLLYLQSVPLDEMLAVSGMIVSLYFLNAWSKTKYIPSLVIAAFFGLLATLTRYELWFLVFAETTYVLFAALTESKTSNKLKQAEGLLIIFITLGLFGIFLWFLYNFLGWGDPLYFIHHVGGHIDQQKEFESNGLLLTKHNFPFSLLVLFSNILESIGPALLAVTIGALAYLLSKADKLKNKLFYFVTMAPLGFLLLSLFFGITVLFTKMFPLPGTEKVFNVRYGIIALVPAIIIVSTFFATVFHNLKFKSLLYILIALIFLADGYFFYKTAPVAVIDDGVAGISRYGQFDESVIAENVTKNCDQGLTLVSANDSEIIMFSSGLPLKSFIYEGSGAYWHQALNNPESIANCILMFKKGAIYKNFESTSKLQNYEIIYTSLNKDIFLLKKKNSI